MMYEIPPDLEQLFQQQMAIGNYPSPDELLRDALQELARRRNESAHGTIAEPSGNTLEALQQQGLVGSIQSGHPDLSTNPTHMEGFGRNGS